MNYLLSETLYDDNGNCDDMGVNPLCMVVIDGENDGIFLGMEKEIGGKNTVTVEDIREFMSKMDVGYHIVEFDKMVYV